MPRAPRVLPLVPEQLNSEQRALYDGIVGGPRAAGPQHFVLTDDDGGLMGPFNAMLLSPRVGQPLQSLGSSLRFESSLTARARELAILVVAGHWRSDFERTSHTAVGKGIGLSDDEIAAAVAGEDSKFGDGRESAIVGITRTMVREWTLADHDWEDAVAAVGAATLFELSTLVGYYSLLALQLRVFSNEG